MDLNQSGRRLAGLGHKPSKLAITGSNPVDRTKRFLSFELCKISCLKWFSTVFESLNPICRINVVEKKEFFFFALYPMLVVLQTSIVEQTLEMFLQKGFRSYGADFQLPRKQ